MHKESKKVHKESKKVHKESKKVHRLSAHPFPLLLSFYIFMA